MLARFQIRSVTSMVASTCCIPSVVIFSHWCQNFERFAQDLSADGIHDNVGAVAVRQMVHALCQPFFGKGR